MPFTHAGVERTLAKHPVIQQKIKRGEITAAEVARAKWYLRFETNGKTRSFKLAANAPVEAVREAKDFLQAREKRPNDFTAFLQQKDAARGLTLGQLADAWFAAGLPFSATKTRTPATQSNIIAL